MSGPARFNPTIHAPNRLRICALLADTKEVEFGTLRDLLSVSDSVLSKQLAVLVEAGYVRSRRAKRGARHRMWLTLTEEGRDCFGAHVAALHEIVGVTANEKPALKLPARPAVPGPFAPSW